MERKRGQITIFIIIAVLIVAGVSVFLMFRGGIFTETIPASIEPFYTTFLSCLEEDALVGINVLESQAGYIELPDFEPGSEYMPFSSQLNFVGNPVPYWYYVSGNNIQKEQVPSKKYMAGQLEDFIEERIRDCSFDTYYKQGFEIEQGEPSASVSIQDKKVEVSLRMDLNVNRGNDSVSLRNHKISVASKLGSLYDSAREVYEYEQDTLFLEEYGVDVMRLYAPVDGVELTCSPLVWGADEVFDDLEEAIEMNTLSLKTKAGDFSLAEKENKYFIVDVSVDNEVRFLNSRNWSNGFEVTPSDGSVMIADVVGNQPGLGILGFCYVPYHFVYNMRYPVLVQVSSGDEIFQFPVAVVIQSNNPRESLDVQAVELEIPEFCKYKNTIVYVDAYDTKLNQIEADISYKCSNTKCYIGKTSPVQTLAGEFPQCVNGYILARAEGFEDAKYIYSTTSSGYVDIIMDRLYEMEIDLKLDNAGYNKDAIVSFISDKGSKTIIYPEQKMVELSEGQYEVQVHIYRSSSLNLPASTKNYCMEVPQTGLGGFFGFTKEKCFEVKIPAQIVSNALSGGGTQNYYILESELENSNVIEINARGLPVPNSIEQLQKNYDLFETKDLGIEFR